MRQAPVGFQCPNCISEGAKATRSGRTAYGGSLPRNPTLTSQVLIGLNVAVWVLILATGGRSSVWLDRLGLLPDGGIFRNLDGSLVRIDGVADGAYWQLLTSMFTHVDTLHIGFNMLALWFLGPQLELALGRARFLALYLLSGLTGSAFVYWLSPEVSSTVGASGAIFGLMGGLLVVGLKVKADLSQLLVWLGLNVLITVVGRGMISWQGHLGGLVGGAVIGAVLVYAPRAKRSLVQAVGLGAVAVVLLMAVLLRTLALG
jgi:membrane associated rhomboid family serine protease